MNSTENQDCSEEIDDLPEEGEENVDSAGEDPTLPGEEVDEPAPEEDSVECSIEDELEKWRDLAARSQADLENYRKRMAREKSEAIQYANTALMSSLIPVIDNFEMGLKAAQNEGSDSVIYQGMVMVQKQLQDFLSDNRVEQIEALEGQDFDPNQHEAIQQQASTKVPPGKVIDTMRTGYRLKDRLIRPAMVTVSSGPETETEGPGEDE